MSKAFVVLERSCTSEYNEMGDINVSIKDIASTREVAIELIKFHAESLKQRGGYEEVPIDENEGPTIRKSEYEYSIWFGDHLDWVEFYYEEYDIRETSRDKQSLL